jgi:hypothetical protein
MNSKTLARAYDKLTPQERLSLLVAAFARGDEAECDRILRAAPMIRMRVSADFGVTHAFFWVAMLSHAEQLASAVGFWQAHSMAADELLQVESSEGDDRLAFVMDMHAWRFRMERQAWRRFCDESSIDPDAYMNGMPGQCQIELVESILLEGPSDDELAERIRNERRLPDSANLISAESILAGHHELYADVSDRWM